MSLAVLGPFGIMILTTLQDNGSLPGDLYQQFVGKLKFYLRVPLELCFFVLAWIVAYQTMILIRNLSIVYESVTTGRTIAEIIGIQNASSGMWAFSEELEVMYLMGLFYLLCPICFNAICRPPKLWASVKKAYDARRLFIVIASPCRPARHRHLGPASVAGCMRQRLLAISLIVTSRVLKKGGEICAL